MVISKTIEFDMGHRVPNHKSKCRNLHGHRYKVEVFVEGETIRKEGDSSEGMVIDFSDLKEVMMSEIDEKFDHGFMIYNMDEFLGQFSYFLQKGQKVVVVPFVPTAENIVKHIADLIREPLEKRNIKLHSIHLWETPTSLAIHVEEYGQHSN